MKIFDRKAHQEEIRQALQDGSTGKIFLAFFFPKATRKFLLRLFLVILISYLFFRFLALPVFIKGASMSPTYPERSFNFCWRLYYLFHEPEVGDIVIVSYGSRKGMLLKRVIAKGGDTVEFRKGKLFRNGRKVKEDYVIHPCSWDLPPRKVAENSYYLAGDNRSMDIKEHVFGAIHKRYLLGAPLW
ncbi:MAG: signal peptidase I [Lentisphaeria bacterium]|nr:signal peptidase I [Lentisphaeria bacterium]